MAGVAGETLLALQCACTAATLWSCSFPRAGSGGSHCAHCAHFLGRPWSIAFKLHYLLCVRMENIIIALVIHRTVLHDLSVLAIHRTTQINSRPMEIIYSWQKNGELHWLWVWFIWEYESNYVGRTRVRLELGVTVRFKARAIRLLSCV